jgi:bifunctional DNA-binding transcriptional regulator/antitoxin component of YhaV-PrlF toxin-antitoxin module
MTKHLCLVAVGDEIAVILPSEWRERLDAHAGETVVADEVETGITLTVEDRHQHAMAVGKQVMDQFSGALAEPAR